MRKKFFWICFILSVAYMVAYGLFLNNCYNRKTYELIYGVVASIIAGYIIHFISYTFPAAIRYNHKLKVFNKLHTELVIKLNEYGNLLFLDKEWRSKRTDELKHKIENIDYYEEIIPIYLNSSRQTEVNAIATHAIIDKNFDIKKHIDKIQSFGVLDFDFDYYCILKEFINHPVTYELNTIHNTQQKNDYTLEIMNGKIPMLLFDSFDKSAKPYYVLVLEIMNYSFRPASKAIYDWQF